MRGRATITVLIALAFLASVFAITPNSPLMNVVAADYEYGYFETRGPSANNSSFYRAYPFPIAPVAAYGAQVVLDGLSQKIQYTHDSLYSLECSDFSNESFPGASEYGWVTMPENATIFEVWVIAEFTANRPEMTIYLDTGEQEAYNTTYVSSGYLSAYWNVTSLQDWDHDLLTDFETRIFFDAWTDAQVPYYCSYLGFWKIVWQGWFEGEAEEDPPEDDHDEGGYDIGYDIGWTNIPGVLGFMGFIGMIAVPAFGVWVARNGESESNIVLTVKILGAWTFCFAMFMYAIAG